MSQVFTITPEFLGRGVITERVSETCDICDNGAALLTCLDRTTDLVEVHWLAGGEEAFGLDDDLF
jgi:hypothetical protein